MDSDQNRPQADGANPPPAAHAPDPGQDFTGEPDFSGFQPDVRESLLPRWLHLSLLWVLGLGAAAALVMAGMFVTQERKTDRTLELLAASSRGELATPAGPTSTSAAGKKATDLVLLPNPAQADPPADPSPAPVPQDALPAKPTAALDSSGAATAGAGADTAPLTQVAPAKSKPVARKKKPRPRQTNSLARAGEAQSWRPERVDIPDIPEERGASQSRQGSRGESRTWPRRRGDSITEKLNAAVAACRARPHAPGECNLRACDILGRDDPACR